jgi:hypothetical protein
MRRILAVLAATLIAAIFIIPAVRAESGNRISTYALRNGVRGYTCNTWAGMSTDARAAFVLGVIALSDALEHGANDQNFSLTTDDYRSLNLPRSANDYASMVTSGCNQVSGTTPVLAVLFTLK